MEQIECSETSAYKIQTPGNHPEENIQHTEHGESLKSKRPTYVCIIRYFFMSLSLSLPCDYVSSLCRVAQRPFDTRGGFLCGIKCYLLVYRTVTY
jgi:hypothetical protein